MEFVQVLLKDFLYDIVAMERMKTIPRGSEVVISYDYLDIHDIAVIICKFNRAAWKDYFSLSTWNIDYTPPDIIRPADRPF